MYVEEVLTLPGIRSKDVELIINTGISAYENCRIILSEDMFYSKSDDRLYLGKPFYKAEWSGGNAWTNGRDSHTQPTQIMTCGSTVNMIMAAALAETLLAAGRIAPQSA